MRRAIALLAFTAMFCSHAAGAKPAASGWHYAVERDAMRGTVKRTACVLSRSVARLGFPYHSQRLELCVRTTGAYTQVFLSLPRGGQFLPDERAMVRLDGGALEGFGCAGTADGSNDTMYFANRDLTQEDSDATSKAFAAQMARHDRAMAAMSAGGWPSKEDDAADAAARKDEEAAAASRAARPGLGAELLTAKQMVVEVTFYQNGRQQFTFDVAGLKM